jgi:hypothetical protein
MLIDGDIIKARLNTISLIASDVTISICSVSSTNTTQSRCYFILKCYLVKENPTEEEASDIRQISDRKCVGAYAKDLRGSPAPYWSGN